MSALGVLVLSAVLARVEGPELLGSYILFYSFVLALATISRAGADYSLVRCIGEVRGVLTSVEVRKITSSIYVFSLIIFTVALGVALSRATGFSPLYLSENFGVYLVCAILMSLNYIVSAILKGIGRAYLAPIFESGITLLLVAGFCLERGRADINFLYVDTIAALSIQLVIACFVLKRLELKIIFLGVHLSERVADFVDGISYFPILLMGYMSEWGVILILAVFLQESDLGVWSVVQKTSYAIVFILMVVNAVFSPRFAAFFRAGRLDLLAVLTEKLSFMLVLLAFPLSILFFVYSEVILGFFGDEFVSAKRAFLILVSAQIFNLITGPAGDLLNMTGNQSVNVRVAVLTSLSYLSSVLVVCVLGGGIYELAIIAALFIFLKNSMQFMAVRYCLGFWTLPGWR